jgi:hypothetical protein
MAKIQLLWPIFEPIESYVDSMETFRTVSEGVFSETQYQKVTLTTSHGRRIPQNSNNQSLE